jgi:hypothetical protein
MTFRYAEEQEEAHDLVTRFVSGIAGRRHTLAARVTDLDALQLAHPHRVYDLRADALASGDGLESAQLSGTRYMVSNGGDTFAAAELRRRDGNGPWFVASLNYGHFVADTLRALAALAVDPSASTSDYEARLLRSSALYLVALWLHSDGDGEDVLYPLAPAPGAIEAERSYDAASFVGLVRPLAQESTAQ